MITKDFFRKSCLKKDSLRLITNAFITGILIVSFNLKAQDNPLSQCIEAPQRDTACPNLIYSSYNNNGANRLFCICKNDKSKLLKLLESGENIQQIKQVRQLVSQHRLTEPELISLLQSVSD